MKTNDELLCLADELLTIGCKTSKHPFHQFNIASFNGPHIEQRNVVLRRWVLKRRTIIFHSDIRAPKISQFKANPNGSILFYSKEDKLQLRFKCFVHVHFNDRLSHFLYSKTTESQRRCYGFSKPPSIEIPYPTKEIYLEKSDEISAVDPFENFAACVCNFNELEILYLNHQGHVRTKYTWDLKGNLTSTNIIA